MEAELATLENEASRRAASLRLDSGAVEDALRQLQPNPGENADDFASRVEEERQRLLANEYLVEAATRETLESAIFPVGFPAEERAREAAQAMVASYESNADAKISWLHQALQNYQNLRTPVEIQYEAPPSLSLQKLISAD